MVSPPGSPKEEVNRAHDEHLNTHGQRGGHEHTQHEAVVLDEVCVEGDQDAAQEEGEHAAALEREAALPQPLAREA